MYKYSDQWYFGDYLESLPGKNYNYIVYFVTILLFIEIAVSTESTLINSQTTLLLDFFLNLIELFFISDYIGKILNTWSKKEYKVNLLIFIFFKPRSFFDFSSLILLTTGIFSTESPVVITAYILKTIFNIYDSKLRVAMKRLAFIFFSNPTKTFFPIGILSILTYLFASTMYVIEKNNDPEHFGSIIRSLWFSVVSVTTIGYGDVTPTSVLGKLISTLFGILGILCIALLTANIVDMDNKYNQKIQEQE